jgi:LCP family protein required for cell wall assembly
VNQGTPGPPDPPKYNVYRARKRPLARGDLDALKRRLSRSRGDEPPSAPREKRPITPGRVAKWIALAIAGWLLLSLALFLVSAATQPGVSPAAERALSSGGNLLTGSTILVLGSDQRTGESIDESDQGPGRSDTIMLVPGHGINKINAAYALGGPALTIETVETFLGNGLEINHLVEVDFEDFPEFIDALGGITVESKSRICSPPFDNFWKGLRFKKGENELDGTRALGFARVRKNSCAPAEDDRDRAARQQEVLRAIGAQIKSPSTFFRLPWVSWSAPKTLKTDMGGLQLMALFADMATGNSSDTAVLEATCCNNGTNLFVSEGSKQDAVQKLLEGD